MVLPWAMICASRCSQITHVISRRRRTLGQNTRKQPLLARWKIRRRKSYSEDEVAAKKAAKDETDAKKYEERVKALVMLTQ